MVRWSGQVRSGQVSKMKPRASSARKTVSSTINIIGRTPTPATFLRDVLTPSAAIAVSSSHDAPPDAHATSSFGSSDRLFTIKSTTNPTKNQGIGNAD